MGIPYFYVFPEILNRRRIGVQSRNDKSLLK
jgi:hypothetical protein